MKFRPNPEIEAWKRRKGYTTAEEIKHEIKILVSEINQLEWELAEKYDKVEELRTKLRELGELA